MKKIIILLITALILIGCSTSRRLEILPHQQDSTHVEVRKEIIYVTDTVYFEIPEQKSERTTADSTSHLENDYATSNARINPDGSLYHDLNTKPQDISKEVQTPVERSDSIVYRYKDKIVIETVEVEKELSWWEKTCIKWFPYLLIALFVITTWTFRNPLKKLIGLIRHLI